MANDIYTDYEEDIAISGFCDIKSTGTNTFVLTNIYYDDGPIEIWKTRDTVSGFCIVDTDNWPALQFKGVFTCSFKISETSYIRIRNLADNTINVHWDGLEVTE
jgi:hypothetical protein